MRRKRSRSPRILDQAADGSKSGESQGDRIRIFEFANSVALANRQVAANTFAIESAYRIDFNGVDSCAGRSLSKSSDFKSNVEITTNPTVKMLLINPVSLRLFEATRDSIANNGNLDHFDRQSN